MQNAKCKMQMKILVFLSSFCILHIAFCIYSIMAQFNFKLHAVLRQRELVEQDRQREFAVAQAEKVAQQAELKRLDDAVRAALLDLRQNQLVGVLNLSYLAAHRRFMADMQRRGVAQLLKVEEASKKAEAVRVLLAEASKNKKIIEKLKEKQQAAWAETLARKETAAMDEIAMQMTASNMIETIKETWNGADEI
jgi:flagellar FliJ protein